MLKAHWHVICSVRHFEWSRNNASQHSADLPCAFGENRQCSLEYLQTRTPAFGCAIWTTLCTNEDLYRKAELLFSGRVGGHGNPELITESFLMHLCRVDILTHENRGYLQIWLWILIVSWYLLFLVQRCTLMWEMGIRFELTWSPEVKRDSFCVWLNG